MLGRGLGRSAFDGLDDPWVAATAAKVWFHPGQNFGLGRLRLFAEQTDEANYHSWDAVATLHRAFRQKGLLHRIQLLAASQPLNGQDLLLVSSGHRCDA